MGHLPRQHGVEQNAQAPDVTAFVIALAFQHLAGRQAGERDLRDSPRWTHRLAYYCLKGRTRVGATGGCSLSPWAKGHADCKSSLMAEEAEPLTSGATKLAV